MHQPPTIRLTVVANGQGHTFCADPDDIRDAFERAVTALAALEIDGLCDYRPAGGLVAGDWVRLDGEWRYVVGAVPAARSTLRRLNFLTLDDGDRRTIRADRWVLTWIDPADRWDCDCLTPDEPEAKDWHLGADGHAYCDRCGLDIGQAWPDSVIAPGDLVLIDGEPQEVDSVDADEHVARVYGPGWEAWGRMDEIEVA